MIYLSKEPQAPRQATQDSFCSVVPVVFSPLGENHRTTKVELFFETNQTQEKRWKNQK